MPPTDAIQPLAVNPANPANPANATGADSHDALLLKIENHAEDILSKNPNAYKDVFQDLDKLRKSEDPQKFAKDLEAINLKLHEDGWLPGMEIVMTPKGGFLVRNQTDPQWIEEQKQRQKQYADRSQGAPAPSASPEGYNSGYSPSGGRSGKGGYTPRPSYDPHMQGSPGKFQYNPNVSGDAAKRILAATHADVHQEMWRQTNHGASGAREGCAASVSSVLRQAGVSNVHEMECHRLQAALQKEGWTVSHTPQPGDVVFGYGGLSRAHVGIVGENGTAFDNHSSTGQWSQDKLSYFGNWHQTVFLHPPQGQEHAENHTPPPEQHTPLPAHHVATPAPVVSAG